MVSLAGLFPLSSKVEYSFHIKDSQFETGTDKFSVTGFEILPEICLHQFESQRVLNESQPHLSYIGSGEG